MQSHSQLPNVLRCGCESEQTAAALHGTLFGGKPDITYIDFFHVIVQYNELTSVGTCHRALLSDHTEWKLGCLSGTFKCSSEMTIRRHSSLLLHLMRSTSNVDSDLFATSVHVWDAIWEENRDKGSHLRLNVLGCPVLRSEPDFSPVSEHIQ